MNRPCFLLMLAVSFLAVAIGAEPPGRVDPYGDPLPEGAVARFGTVRFRAGKGIHSALLSPDGKTVATSNFDALYLWDVATGRLLWHSAKHISHVAFSPDGRTVAVLDTQIDEDAPAASARILMLDVATGKELRAVTAPTWYASAFVFSADGRRLAAVCPFDEDTDAVHVLDLVAGTWTRPIRGVHARSVLPVLSPDGRTLVTWGWGQSADRRSPPEDWRDAATVQVWEVATGKERGRIVVDYPELQSVAFSPDGSTIAVAAGSQISLWDTATFQRRTSWQTRPGVGSFLTWSPDGSTIAAALAWRDSIVQEWDAQGRRRGTFVAPKYFLSNITWTPDGRLLGCGPNGSAPLVWDVHRGRALTPPERSDPIERLSFVNNGAQLSVVSDGVRAEIWDVAKRKEHGRVILADFELERHRACVEVDLRDLTPIRNGKDVAFVFEGRVYVRDVPAGEDVCMLPKAESARLLTVSPDGQRIAAVQRGEITFWDAETCEVRHTIPVQDTSDFKCATFSPDGSSLALGVFNCVCLCDPVRGKELRLLRVEQDVIALAIAPDGKSVAVHEKDVGLRLWDIASGKRLRSFDGFDGKLTSVPVFTPDGRHLVCAGQEEQSDGIILIWDTASGRLRRQLRGHLGSVTALAVSPDGKLLASGGSDTTVLLWDLAAASK